MTYNAFIESKAITDAPSGIGNPPPAPSFLMPFQRDLLQWSLRRGRAALFADCGMGKTVMQLCWADAIPGRVLIVAPLAVGKQTEAEAEKFGISEVKYMREDDGFTRIAVTNYEMLHHFDPARFKGIVLDESSILKSYTGKFRNYIIEEWAAVPFRLAATATPAPNDFMELGNHAEFLGAMTRTEMLSHFFVHDGGETQKWRIKRHAEHDFWEWVCSWAVMLRKPSDLGYDDGDFILPKLTLIEESVDADHQDAGFLFAMPASTLIERRDARRASLDARVNRVAELANGRGQWLVWCDMNAESSELANRIKGSVEVKGSDSVEHKESALHGFAAGSIRVLITKPSIAGHGMNFQRCNRMAFTGLSDSYEQFYQAVRRCWRFGQKKPVKAYIVTSSLEGAVVRNIKRKESDADRMASMMIEKMHSINETNIKGTQRTFDAYAANHTTTPPAWL